jgi:hypothetical protein
LGWTRASATDRELRCPGSLIYQRDDSVPNEGSEWGHLVHNWKATGLVKARAFYPNHAALFRRKLEIVNPQRRQYWPDGGTHEVAVAVNCLEPKAEWATGLNEEEIDAWKAQWPDFYITGAIDYLGEILDDPWVDDLKTGKRDSPLDDPPRVRSQVWTYALAAYLIKRSASQVRTSITWWPRYPVAAEPLALFQSIKANELERWWQHLNKKYTGLVQLRKRPETIEAHLKEGPYCFFCPSKHYCPKGKEQDERVQRFPYDSYAD